VAAILLHQPRCLKMWPQSLQDRSQQLDSAGLGFWDGWKRTAAFIAPEHCAASHFHRFAFFLSAIFFLTFAVNGDRIAATHPSSSSKRSRHLRQRATCLSMPPQKQIRLPNSRLSLSGCIFLAARHHAGSPSNSPEKLERFSRQQNPLEPQQADLPVWSGTFRASAPAANPGFRNRLWPPIRRLRPPPSVRRGNTPSAQARPLMPETSGGRVHDQRTPRVAMSRSSCASDSNCTASMPCWRAASTYAGMSSV